MQVNFFGNQYNDRNEVILNNKGGVSMAKKDEKSSSNEIAEKSFDPSDYCSKNEVEKGLAITHEQVSDTFTEGTIEGEIDNIERKLNEFPHRISK
jgi:hypothetical protein